MGLKPNLLLVLLSTFLPFCLVNLSSAASFTVYPTATGSVLPFGDSWQYASSRPSDFTGVQITGAPTAEYVSVFSPSLDGIYSGFGVPNGDAGALAATVYAWSGSPAYISSSDFPNFFPDYASAGFDFSGGAVEQNFIQANSDGSYSLAHLLYPVKSTNSPSSPVLNQADFQTAFFSNTNTYPNVNHSSGDNFNPAYGPSDSVTPVTPPGSVIQYTDLLSGISPGVSDALTYGLAVGAGILGISTGFYYLRRFLV